jgi:hypothetical protein
MLPINVLGVSKRAVLIWDCIRPSLCAIALGLVRDRIHFKALLKKGSRGDVEQSSQLFGNWAWGKGSN